MTVFILDIPKPQKTQTVNKPQKYRFSLILYFIIIPSVNFATLQNRNCTTQIKLKNKDSLPKAYYLQK